MAPLADTPGMPAMSKKTKANQKRQESGYAVKDHADSRHI